LRTHTRTHTAAPGEQLGVRCLAQGHLRCFLAVLRIKLLLQVTLWVKSLTLWPLGHVILLINLPQYRKIMLLVPLSILPVLFH